MGNTTQLISNFINGALIPITRYGASPGVVNGVVVDGTAAAPFNVVMSVQPMNGKDLKQLPMKLQFDRRVQKGYCDVELFTIKTSPSKRADRASYDGTIFEVYHVERWDGDLPHWKVWLVEVDK